MSDPYLEAAIKAGQRAAFINNGDLSYATEVKEIVKAWVGDRTLYEPCSDCGGSGVIQVSDTKGIECQLCRFSPTVMILEGA